MPDSHLNKIALIFLGNADRGDDALGMVIAKQLKNYFADPLPPLDAKSIVICKTLGEPTALWDLWEGYKHVIVIDAFQSTEYPSGTLLYYNPEQLITAGSCTPFSTHGMGLLEAVKLGKELSRLPDHLDILGIVGNNFSHFAPLSLQVEKAMPRLFTEVLKRIKRLNAAIGEDCNA